MSGQEDLQKWLQQLKSRAENKPHPAPERHLKQERPTRPAKPAMQSMLEEIFEAAKAAHQASGQNTEEHERRMTAERQRHEEEQRREEAEHRAIEARKREKAKLKAEKRLNAERAAMEEKRRVSASRKIKPSQNNSDVSAPRPRPPLAKALRKRLLRGPAAMREAIVLAEILGKPKALREDNFPQGF